MLNRLSCICVYVGYRSEVDLFVCRSIILLLGRGNYPYGRALYQAVGMDAELLDRLSESPLFHMVGVLLDLIEVSWCMLGRDI